MLKLLFSALNEITDLALELILIVLSVIFIIFLIVTPAVIIYNFEYIGFLSLIVPLFLFRVYLKSITIRRI